MCSSLTKALDKLSKRDELSTDYCKIALSFDPYILRMSVGAQQLSHDQNVILTPDEGTMCSSQQLNIEKKEQICAEDFFKCAEAAQVFVALSHLSVDESGHTGKSQSFSLHRLAELKI